MKTMAIVNINEDNKLYTGSDSADTIYSSDYIRHKNVTIIGGSGHDTIGKSDKTIWIYDSKVTGDEGSDVMYINAVSSSVNGGSGDDTIRIGANYSTIDGSTLTFNTNQGSLTVLNGSKTSKKGVITGNKITMVNADGFHWRR